MKTSLPVIVALAAGFVSSCGIIESGAPAATTHAPFSWIHKIKVLFSMRIPSATVIVVLLVQSVFSACSAVADYADSRQEINLASDTAWTLRCDDGPTRPIKVPGGGWNSDLQSPQIPSAAVKDHVVYERQIVIPAKAEGQAVQIEFGGCNYGAEVWLDDKKVAEHTGPMTPFEADLTGVVQPGKMHKLRVHAYTKTHYGKIPDVPVPFDFNRGSSSCSKWEGNTKFAYGLIGHVRLVVLPLVHVAELFVQPSVTKKQLTCEAWIANRSPSVRKVRLAAAFSSWNNMPWNYPSGAVQELEILAGQTVKTTFFVPWTLGPESYWWPNIPFREEYRATLHFLNLSLADAGDTPASAEVSPKMKSCSTNSLRFGFVEHAEGPYYYTVNGVRYTSLSDSNSYGQVGEYDCWTETACFQTPHGTVKGCPETWKRYQRLGFNSMRLSTSVPTETLLATADEAGFMLIPEGGSWGNHTAVFHRQNFGRQLQDAIRIERNHPSVARYSVCNEPREKRDGNWVWRGTIDDAHAADPTRPLVIEAHKQGSGRVDGLQNRGHAFIMEHYAPIDKVGEGKGIRGMGECDWGTDNLGSYAVNIRKYRLYDWAHVAPWSLVNFWPNLLEGMNHARHPWKVNNHADRTDGVDGWGSPLVKFLQTSQHPYLIQDLGTLTENPGAPRGHEKGRAEWPYQFPAVLAGQPVERQIEVFNGGLTGNQLTLRWSAHWDAPTGPEALTGGEIACTIEPGFHATQPVAFTVPKIEQDERKLYLVLESCIDGKTVFHSEETCLKAMARKVDPAAAFLGADDKVQGDWDGKYGADGHELVGHEVKFPAFAKFAWTSGKVWTYDKATDDKRALAYFMNPPTGKDRIAAAHYGDEVTFTLDAGSAPRRLTLYFLDYDKKSRKQTVEFFDTQTGKSLSKQEVTEFANGKYLTWKIQGPIKCTISKTGADAAMVSGVFLDP